MKKQLIKFVALAFLAIGSVPAVAAIWDWSTTASNNGNADPTINLVEGMAPSAVNNSARAMMAAIAAWRNDISVAGTTSGTSTAYTLTSSEGFNTTPSDKQMLAFIPHVTNGVNAKLTIDGGNQYPIQTSPGVAVGAGVLVLGSPYRVSFSSANSSYLLQDFYNTTVPAGSIVTSMLQDNAVTYPKIQKPTTTSRLLGTPSLASTAVSGASNNGSGLIRLTVGSTTGYSTGQTKVVSGVVGTTEANGSWTITVINGTTVDLQGSTFANAYVSGGTLGGSVEEISVAGGAINGNVLTIPFPPAGSFKNLSIKVTGNTAATAAADYVTTTNGSAFQTTALSCSLNMATTGAGGIDAGSIASATWYAVWTIAKSDGTTTCEASLQGTANVTFLSNLPSGYTYYARIGWLRTATGSAQLLGTWQFGRKAKYVSGLAQTTAIPSIAAPPAGNPAIPTFVAKSISNYVPTTASIISVNLYASMNANNATVLAPNNTYGAYTASTNPPPVVIWTGGAQSILSPAYDMLIESSNVYYAADSGTSAAIIVNGWEDNL